MRAHAIGLLFALISMTTAGVATGQTPPKPSPTPTPAPPPAAAQPQRPPAEQNPESYSYQPEGRRDPFLNLLGSGTDPAPGPRKGDGPASMMVADISVRGVIQSKGGWVALIRGPANK